MSIWKKSLTMVILSVLILTSLNAVAAREDSDYDGLCDEDENALNLDPDNPDTDGDGINDLDDPTPKGSLINSEEIWELESITVTSNVPIATFGTRIIINVSVGDDSEATGVTLFHYVSPSYYRLDLIKEEEGPIDNHRAVFEYTPQGPGNYYFVAVVNKTGLPIGNEAMMSEITSLHKARRLGYVMVPCYPKNYASIESLYDNLLEGHDAKFRLEYWEFEPVNNSYDFLKRFSASYAPENTLGLLYRRAAGKPYIGIDKEFAKDAIRVNVPAKGTYWTYRFDQAKHYNIKISAYPFDQKWDFNFYSRMFEDYTSIVIHDPLVQWIEGPENVEIYDKVEVTFYRYNIDNKISEGVFDSLYYSIGMIGIVKNLPTFAIPSKDIVTFALYYVADEDYLYMAHKVNKMDGFIKLSYKVQVPGYYETMVSKRVFNEFLDPNKVISGDDHFDNRYFMSRGFHATTDVRVHLYTDNEDYFPSETIRTLTDVYTGGASPSDIKVRIDIAKKEKIKRNSWYYYEYVYFGIHDDFTDGMLGPYSQGDYLVKSIPHINAETRRVAALFGPSRMSGDWIGVRYFSINNLAIYASMPSVFHSSGRESFRIVVHGEAHVPSVGTRVEIGAMDRDDNVVKVFLTGTTDTNGIINGSLNPSSYLTYNYRLFVRAHGNTGSTTVFWGAVRIGSEPRFYITTSKPIYRPGDRIDVRITGYDTGAERPLSGSAQVRLIDPYHATVNTSGCSLNEYGVGSCDLQLPDFLAWGSYRLEVTCAGEKTTKYVEIRYYETPDVMIEVEEEEDVVYEPGDVAALKVKVKYVQGEPVLGGTFNYTIKGQRYAYRNYYDPWAYEDYYSDYYRYYPYWGLKPITGFELEGVRELTDGATVLVFTIPENAAFISFDLEYDDGYNNTASLTHHINIGPQGELTKGLRLELDKTEVSPEEDVAITAAIDTFIDNIAMGHVPNVNFTLKISGYDNYGLEHVLYENTINTGEGVFSKKLSELGIDLGTNFKDKIFTYCVDIYVLDRELRLQLLDSASVNFLVYWQEYTASLPKYTFNPGEKVGITFSTHDYSTGGVFHATGQLMLMVS